MNCPQKRVDGRYRQESMWALQEQVMNAQRVGI